MATGGNVVESTSAEAVLIFGRVSSAAAKVAPANGSGKWTVSSGGTGVYNIVFAQSYPEFLGCQLTLESASGILRYVFTPATKTLVISAFNVDGTTAAAKAFAFVATFNENLAP